MFKAIILLKKKNDKTRDEFADWWFNQHRPLAEQLPGLRRAVFNLVTEPEESDFDGISELWFESQSEFESAYASEIGVSVAADSVANVERRQRMLVTELVIK